MMTVHKVGPWTWREYADYRSSSWDRSAGLKTDHRGSGHGAWMYLDRPMPARHEQVALATTHGLLC